MNAERLECTLQGKTSEERYRFFSETTYCVDAMKRTFPTIPEQIFEEMKGKIQYIIDVVNLFNENEYKICEY